MREQSMPLLDCLRWLYYIHLGGSCCYLVTTAVTVEVEPPICLGDWPAWPSAAQPPVSLLLAKFVLCHISTTYNLMVIT